MFPRKVRRVRDFVGRSNLQLREIPSQTKSHARSPSSDIDNTSENDRRLKHGLWQLAPFLGSLCHFWLADLRFRILKASEEASILSDYTETNTDETIFNTPLDRHNVHLAPTRPHPRPQWSGCDCCADRGDSCGWRLERLAK